MKVYWDQKFFLTGKGSIRFFDGNLKTHEKEYNLLTNEELEEIKKQAIADYEKARWINVINKRGKLVMEQAFYSGAEDQRIAPNSVTTSSVKKK